jgi:saccharopine dehydrogenase-like NADP-dependent oxidoreductase
VTRVLVLGGSGNFGSRIVRALRHEPAIELICAGRRGKPAAGAESVRVAVVDIRAAGLIKRFLEIAPGIVIHCAGPYQGQDYTVARAAIAVGAHYLDLADGRAFVSGFREQLDDSAHRAGVVALTGVSTLPALSSAVIDVLRIGLTRLGSVHVIIAPGQRASRGVATLAAVFSYLGKPFKVWRSGRWENAWGWMGLERVDLAVGQRLSAWCDVPDLELLPAHYPGIQTVTFKAALEFWPQHVALWSLACLRRAGVRISVENWAPVLERFAACWDRFAGNSGGMRVRVTGADATGKVLTRDWQVVAEAEKGPEIPCMAAILVAKRMISGQLPLIGARPCLSELPLEEFAPEFERWGMRVQIGEYR